jgi:type VI secretion system VasD/TssJ family lipoprotein
MIRHRSWHLASVLALAVVAMSCGKAPPPVAAPAPPPATIAAAPDAKIRLPLTLTAAADANPNARGTAQPIVVRVYQLRSDQAFLKADQEDLFDDEQKVLGQEVIGSSTEYLIDPNQKQTHEVNFATEAAYIGIAAAFFDIRNAQWRQVLFTPRKGMTVSVERARLTVTPVK